MSQKEIVFAAKSEGAAYDLMGLLVRVKGILAHVSYGKSGVEVVATTTGSVETAVNIAETANADLVRIRHVENIFSENSQNSPLLVRVAAKHTVAEKEAA